jgi:hypothetical protein
MKKLLVSLSFLLCFTITSCSPNKPPIEFDSAYLNKQIRLIALKELSAFKTNEDVAVHLEYNTENKIVFPNNYNLRIFIQEQDKWIEIKEKPTVRPENQVVLSPEIPTSYGQIVGFWPQLDDLTKTYRVRVYVFGDMTTSEGTKQVAAFVDFVLTP